MLPIPLVAAMHQVPIVRVRRPLRGPMAALGSNGPLAYFSSASRGEDSVAGRLELPPGAKIHLVGIHGSGMSCLAQVLAGQGYEVVGSDAAAGGNLEFIRVRHGHRAEHLDADTRLLVYSRAVEADNPERAQARQWNIRQCSYPEMVGRLMQDRRGVAIAGTHGKSTTTAMLGRIATQAGCDPTVLVGAELRQGSTAGRAGHGQWLVAEACEYRHSFLSLRPQLAAVLGLEHDHLDCYATVDEVQQAFAQFVHQLPADGTLLANLDCARTRQLSAQASARVRTFSLGQEADWRAVDLRHQRGFFRLMIYRDGRKWTSVELPIPGRHQALNALAACALAGEMGLPPEVCRQVIESFPGLRRRLEPRGTWQGVTLVVDYAHHPTAIAAGLRTLRQCFPGRRLWCLFQPHQVSRTLGLLDELAESLHNADRVGLFEVYPAREAAEVPVAAATRRLADRVRHRGTPVLPAHNPAQLSASLLSQLDAGDLVVVMAAGDLGTWCDDLVDGLQTLPATE